ncbi:MAG TPA: 50S ribosomal protein L18 [Actinomycetota bacterium]|nr:50S ribosomal protein L18 [Actinomycetota bacterium]
MLKAAEKRTARIRRHRRVRKKVFGEATRPRVAVFRSNRHIYVQLIDDLSGRTLVSASDLDAELRGSDGKKTDRARAVGALLARRAREAGIERAVFDRGGRLYHGRVQAVAEGAREGGLEI